MKTPTNTDSLKLNYAVKFKTTVGLAVLVLSIVWIRPSTDIYGYLMLGLVLAALVLLLHIVGLFSTTSVIELTPKGIRDFRRNKQRISYDWQDFSRIFIKHYSRAGYYFVCQGEGASNTIRFPVGVWNASGLEIATYIERIADGADLPMTVDFSDFYAAGFKSL